MAVQRLAHRQPPGLGVLPLEHVQRPRRRRVDRHQLAQNVDALGLQVDQPVADLDDAAAQADERGEGAGLFVGHRRPGVVVVVGAEEDQVVVVDPEPVLQVPAPARRAHRRLQALLGHVLVLPVLRVVVPDRHGVEREPHRVEVGVVEAQAADAEEEGVLTDALPDRPHPRRPGLLAGHRLVEPVPEQRVVGEVHLQPLEAPLLHERCEQVGQVRLHVGVRQVEDLVVAAYQRAHRRAVGQPVGVGLGRLAVLAQGERRHPQARDQAPVADLLAQPGRTVGEAVLPPPPVAVVGLVAVVDLEPVEAPVAQLGGHHVQALHHQRLVDVRAVAAGGARAAPGVPAVGHPAPLDPPVPGHAPQPGGQVVGVALQARQRVGLRGVHAVRLAGLARAGGQRDRVGLVGLLGGEVGEGQPPVVGRVGPGRLVAQVEDRGAGLHRQGAGDPGRAAVQVDDRVVPVGDRVADEVARYHVGPAGLDRRVAGAHLGHEVEHRVGAVLQDPVVRRVLPHQQRAGPVAGDLQRPRLRQQDLARGAVDRRDVERPGAGRRVADDRPDQVRLALGADAGDAEPIAGAQRGVHGVLFDRALPVIGHGQPGARFARVVQLHEGAGAEQHGAAGGVGHGQQTHLVVPGDRRGDRLQGPGALGLLGGAAGDQRGQDDQGEGSSVAIHRETIAASCLGRKGLDR